MGEVEVSNEGMLLFHSVGLTIGSLYTLAIASGTVAVSVLGVAEDVSKDVAILGFALSGWSGLTPWEVLVTSASLLRILERFLRGFDDGVAVGGGSVDTALDSIEL